MVIIKSISEKIYDISEFLLKVVLLVIALGYAYYIISYHMTNKGNTVQTVEEEKPDYIPADIEKKYPEDFKSYGEFIEKVKKNAVKSDKKIEEDKYHAKYYDSKGREIYSIDELWGRKKNSWHSGRGGVFLERAFPNEKGILYDEKGNIAEKLEIETTGSVTYYSKGTDDEPRRNLYETGNNPSSNNNYTRYEYDKNNRLIKEIQITPSNWFIKEEINYKNGKKQSEKKIIDYEVTYEDKNKIYVEITKEYDKNEKLIKKFVLRKNRVNAVRSETNFDMIKGEIVTKYYDGDKVFATVTETLIGKDRAIVKRERVGDEFVIWDLDNLKKQSESIFWKRYITNKEGIIMYELNCERQMTYNYNYLPIGIYNESFINDFLYYEIDKDYGIGGIILNKIYQYNYNHNKIEIAEIENQKKIADDFYLMNIKNINSKIKKSENQESKKIEKIDMNKIMEDFKNGY